MKVAVIGAGTMGSGIGQAFAQSDAVEKVYLCDIKQEFADGGKAKIKKNLDRQVAKGKMEQAKADEILGKVVTGLADIAVDPDLVVEAVLEKMDLKQATFRNLQENIVKNPDCIYASNTSSLSITEIGTGLAKPVVGMHFFNPAPVMKLVEVIQGANTPDSVVAKVKEISETIGKTPVQVNEAAGFVVNRILVPMINEAINVYYTGKVYDSIKAGKALLPEAKFAGGIARLLQVQCRPHQDPCRPALIAAPCETVRFFHRMAHRLVRLPISHQQRR